MRLTSDGDLNASGGSKVESSLKTTSATSRQVHLGTNTINELRAAVVDRLDEVDESSELRVRAVQAADQLALSIIRDGRKHTCNH